ncbi:PepSY domain-containing protein [Pseudomonas sp. TMP25]|uniref:PepSY domain-containing protein n=1 Tax=Pseudomonas sp. TMP25 TaxID=3136561 RepID=UPI00310165BE
MLQRTHVLLSLVLGVLLMVSAATGMLLSSSTLVEHMQAAPAVGENVADVAARIAGQVTGIERIERAPSGELRVAFSNASENAVVVVDPVSGLIISPYQPSTVLAWTRNLHRELLLGEPGRWLSGLAALALLLLALTGAWLLARRLGGWSQLVRPIPANSGLIHWHMVVARWTLPALMIIALSGIYLAAISQGLISDGQDTTPPYPETRYSAPAAALGSLAALRNLDLQDLRELEFPNDPEQTNYFTVRTATGVGFVNASSGQWIDYQQHGFATRVYETLYELHTGAYSPLWALVLSGSSLAVLFLSGFGLLSWWRRKRLAGAVPSNSTADTAQVILLVGSQGGSTWGYARQLQQQLQAQGLRVHCASMNQLQPQYRQAQQLLVLTSTYGDGQAPDSASMFLSRLQSSQLNPALRVAVLGFGDSQFQHFCGYAQQVEHALQQQGLPSLLPLQCIDRNALSTLNQWAQTLSPQLGVKLHFMAHTAGASTQQMQLQLQLQLLNRELYGENSASPAAILRFAVTPQGAASFAPGDLLAIHPGQDLPPRFYSIASGDEDAVLEICVRKQPNGLCSSLLHELKVGEYIEGAIQAHPQFRPTAGQHPVVLIGAGTGLAPLIGFVRKNTNQRPLHLYWGGRSADSDFLYKNQLSEYLADGRLTRLGLAFSQAAKPMYVQDRLQQDASELVALLQQGAQVLVCGSRDMAAGVRNVLEPLLQQLGLSIDQLRQQGRYREDVY